MILTVDRKRRFLITMLVIMGCATAINYGLYNVLSTYLNTNNDSENDIYSGVQLNIIIIIVIIAVVTVLMIILIPKENVSELMNRISNPDGTVLTGAGSGGRSTSLGLGDSVGTDYDKELDDMVDEDIEEGLNIGEKK